MIIELGEPDNVSVMGRHLPVFFPAVVQRLCRAWKERGIQFANYPLRANRFICYLIWLFKKKRSIQVYLFALLLIVSCMHLCMCTTYVTGVHGGLKSWWVQWNWSDCQLGADIWVLWTSSGNRCPLSERQVFFTVESALWPSHLILTRIIYSGQKTSDLGTVEPREVSPKPAFSWQKALFAGQHSQRSWSPSGSPMADQWIPPHLSVPRKEGSGNLAAE